MSVIDSARPRRARAARRAAAFAAVLLLPLVAAPAAAQQPAMLVGTVTAATGEPLASVSIAVEGSDRGAVTDAIGRYTLQGVPSGSQVVVARRIGYAPERREVTLAAGSQRVDFVLREAAIEMSGVVVSTTREMRLKSQTPASVGVVSGQEIRDAKPSHPAEIAGRVPGVWVSAASGEGHMTAIRQPRTTKPMYLFLEDGVPTRSTGFFNHNALYEINVPQADRMEVLKGPATALYGSDAIGGVINVETRRAALRPQWETSLESGSNGWMRALLSGSRTVGNDGFRADLNLTRSDGFRDASQYDRQSATLRWDRYLPGGATLKTVATYSRIDQGDAGSIREDDYLERSRVNYVPAAFRRVDALRVSTELVKPFENGLLSVTPFFRSNDMELLPTWMVSYDPVVYSTGHRSYGALARYRHDLGFWSGRVIGGVDLEYSPGQRLERTIAVTREDGRVTGYTEGAVIYDYDVAFRGASPYLQADVSPLDGLQFSLGLRYDHVGYDYVNHLGVEQSPSSRWRRPESTDLRYDHLSPKLGVNYTVAPALGLFASYRHGFRAPSEGSIFRQGTSEVGVGLTPVKADNYEFGVRGEAGGRFTYEASVYRMDVTDDILTFVVPVPGVPNALNRINANAGATRHEGIEAGVGMVLGYGVRLDASYSNALHTYREWSPSPTESYAGKRMEAAPRELINARLGYAPEFLRDTRLAVEWVRVGRYFMDAANSREYPGHNLINLLANVPVTSNLELVGRVHNLFDERYAESAALSRLGAEYSPGRPRAVNLGVQYRWQQ